MRSESDNEFSNFECDIDQEQNLSDNIPIQAGIKVSVILSEQADKYVQEHGPISEVTVGSGNDFALLEFNQQQAQMIMDKYGTNDLQQAIAKMFENSEDIVIHDDKKEITKQQEVPIATPVDTDFKSNGSPSFTTKQPMAAPHFFPSSSYPVHYPIASPMETRQDQPQLKMTTTMPMSEVQRSVIHGPNTPLNPNPNANVVYHTPQANFPFPNAPFQQPQQQMSSMTTYTLKQEAGTNQAYPQPVGCPNPPCPGLLCTDCYPDASQGLVPGAANTEVYISCETARNIFHALRNPCYPRQVKLEFAQLFTEEMFQYMNDNVNGNLTIPAKLYYLLVDLRLVDRDHAANMNKNRPIGPLRVSAGAPAGDPSDPSNFYGSSNNRGQDNGPSNNNNGSNGHRVQGSGPSNSKDSYRGNQGFGNNGSYYGGNRNSAPPPPPPPPPFGNGNGNGDGDDPNNNNNSNFGTGNFSRNPNFDRTFQGTGSFPSSTARRPQGTTNEALERLVQGTGRHTADERLEQSLKMFTVPYRPSLEPPKIKTQPQLINHVRNSPRQLKMWISHHAVYGVHIYLVMIGLYNGDPLATAAKFSPKLGFEPLDKLRSNILAKPHLRELPTMEDPTEVIQEYINHLIYVYLKMLIFAVDSKGVKNQIEKWVIPSYLKIHVSFCKMLELSEYVDGPPEAIARLIGKEFMDAAHRYDADQTIDQDAINQRFNGLTQELKSTIKSVAKKAIKNGVEKGDVELLYDATEEMSKSNDRFRIDSGRGSENILGCISGTEAPKPTNNKSRDQPLSNTRNNSGLPRNANKRVLFTSSGLSSFADEENDYEDTVSENKLLSIETMKEVYHYANNQDELPAHQDFPSFAQDRGLSSEEALYHGRIAQQVFHDAQELVTQEFKQKADEEAEKLRLESVAKQERLQFRSSVIQAAKSEIMPLVRKEFDEALQQNATDDNMTYERDNSSDTDMAFANSGALVPRQIHSNDYQFNEQHQNVVTPFDVPYPPLGNSSLYKKPNNVNSFGQVRNSSFQTRQPQPNIGETRTSQYIEGYCVTCGLSPTECKDMRPTSQISNSSSHDRCYLRDQPLASRVDFNSNNLSHLRLAALSPEKLDKVLNASHRNGCLKGAPYSIIAETKANILSERESLGMVLANKST